MYIHTQYKNTDRIPSIYPTEINTHNRDRNTKRYVSHWKETISRHVKRL